MHHVGSSSLTRDWTQGPRHCKPGVLTAGLPRKSLGTSLISQFSSVQFSRSVMSATSKPEITSVCVCVCVCVSMCSVSSSCLTLCDLMDYSHQSPLSMRFSRQEYWSALPCPPPGYLSQPGIEPASLTSPTLEAGSLPLAATWQAPGQILFPATPSTALRLQSLSFYFFQRC